jgi:hypothetical protein
MGTEENKAVARRCVEEIWNKGDLAAVDELLASGYVHHVAGAETVRAPKGWGNSSPDSAPPFPTSNLRLTIRSPKGTRS